jgi:hypothetical protein
MKKIIGLSLVIFLGCSSMAMAQSTVHKAGHEVKEGAKKVGHETVKGAKKVGNKTAELASKGKSKIADKTVKDKTGPNGQTIYLDDQSRYYWVDKKGHKQYVTDAELKVKG